MSITADVAAILAADATLNAALPGGIFENVGEISRQETPGAFDANGEIQPCALVKSGSEIPTVQKINAVQTPVVIYFYERRGYSHIDAAMARAIELLGHRHQAQVWEMMFETEIARSTDDGLNCSLAVQRYNVIRKKY